VIVVLALSVTMMDIVIRDVVKIVATVQETVLVRATVVLLALLVLERGVIVKLLSSPVHPRHQSRFVGMDQDVEESIAIIMIGTGVLAVLSAHRSAVPNVSTPAVDLADVRHGQANAQ
jgi:hypothetical protein